MKIVIDCILDMQDICESRSRKAFEKEYSKYILSGAFTVFTGPRKSVDEMRDPDRARHLIVLSAPDSHKDYE